MTGHMEVDVLHAQLTAEFERLVAELIAEIERLVAERDDAESKWHSVVDMAQRIGATQPVVDAALAWADEYCDSADAALKAAVDTYRKMEGRGPNIVYNQALEDAAKECVSGIIEDGGTRWEIDHPIRRAFAATIRKLKEQSNG